MAAARHNLSRRALLGAGVGLCVGPGASALAQRREAPIFRSGPRRSKGALDSDPAEAGLRLAQAERAGRDRTLRLAWDRALARFRRAEAALAECRAEQAALPAALRAWPHSQALDDRFGRLDDVRLAALRRLLRTPAPDLAALALKIDLTIDDQAWELTGAEALLDSLKADAGRLANGGQRCDCIRRRVTHY
jgi:hypothetical protein